MKKKQKKSFNIFKFLSVLLILIFIYLLPKIFQKLIVINKIQCVSQYGECPEKILVYKNSEFKRSLYTLKSQVKDELENNILVNSYLIQYKIPSTLKVELVLKKAKYAVFDNLGKYYLLDNDGLVVAVDDKVNLPFLKVKDSKFEIGQNVGNELLKLLQIIEKVNFLYSINNGTYENNYMYIVFDNGIKAIFPVDGDTDYLVGSLRLIFSRLNDERSGIKMNEIDFRYKEVIIR